MNIEYKRDLNHNYVILDSPDLADTSAYQVRMILSNDISGLLTCSLRGVDGKTLFCYEITSLQSLKNLYEHKSMESLMLIQLYEQIFQVLEYIEQFLLNVDDLVLSPELIFLNSESSKISFCFLPGYGKDIRQGLRTLIEHLLPKIDHKNQAAVTTAYGLYRKITQDNCGIDALRSALLLESSSVSSTKQELPPEDLESEDLQRKQILDAFFSASEDEEKPFQNKYVGIGVTLFLTILLILFKSFSLPLWAYLLPLILALSIVFVYVVKRFIAGNFSAHSIDNLENSDADTSHSMKQSDTLPPLYGETELIGSKNLETPYLSALSPASSPSILLNKDLILVGKLSHAVDGVLDSPAVSRIHAKIKKKDDEFYIGDLSSRNGTFVNGNPVKGEDEVKLNNGDEITFADMKYRFTE